MLDFELNLKTKLFFGKDKENEIGKILSSYNFKKVLIVSGKGSARKSGLLDKVISLINQERIEYKLLEGIKANPDKDNANKGVDLSKSFCPDIILAIGGGSVIDTAKSIAVGHYYEGDTFDFNLHLLKPTRALPVGVILTISASGSEMSTSCVIQDYDRNIKQGFNSELVRPLFAIENPELTYSVSKEQTAYGIVDILSHTLERFFNKSDDESTLCDEFAIGLIRNVIKFGKIAIDDPYNYSARAELMLASSFSHNGVTSLGKTSGLIVHQLEHALTACYPSIAHGAGLAILYPCWAEEYIKYDVKKFSFLALRIFDIKDSDENKAAFEFVNRLRDFFISIGAPTTYKDVGVDNIDIDRLVNVLTLDGTRKISYHMKDIDSDNARTIYLKGL